MKRTGNGLSAKYHQRIDLTDFESYFSSISEDHWPFELSATTCVFDAWCRDRRMQRCEYIDQRTVACDVVLWARGEPPLPTTTKVGGMAAWPIGKPLPSRDLKFVGQFNFQDSAELHSNHTDLPGEILSLWTSDSYLLTEDYHAVWLSTQACEANLLSFEHHAHPELLIEPFYGGLLRSWDFDETAIAQTATNFPNIEPWPQDWNATKMGGRSPHDDAPGLFLARLGSIGPGPAGIAYPWLNQSDSCTELGYSPNGRDSLQNFVTVGDDCGVCFYLTTGGEIVALPDANY
jgi:hypothetical protein